MDASIVTAARREIKLGDRHFLMSPLTDRDISELDNWVRSRYINMARESLSPQASVADREETLRIAMDRAMSLTWMSGDGLKMIATIDGTTQLLWQSVHHSHKDVTPDDLRKLMLDPRNIALVNQAFNAANVGPTNSFQKRGHPQANRRRKKKC